VRNAAKDAPLVLFPHVQVKNNGACGGSPGLLPLSNLFHGEILRSVIVAAFKLAKFSPGLLSQYLHSLH
jgi:hypothetical protein